MPQSKAVMAYRSRLWRRGYKHVSITWMRGDWYLVTAREPREGRYVRKTMRLDEMERKQKGVKA